MTTASTHHACAAHKAGAAGDFALPGAEKHYPPDLELDPVHLDIDLAVDLADEACAGTVTTTVQARRAGASRLALDAVDFADVAVADPDGHPLTWDYDGQTLVVHWQTPLEAGATRRAAVTYRVAQPTAGLYFSRPSEAYPDAPWWAATDHETERARHWLPCVDQPSARPRLDIRLRADARYTILANGVEVGRTAHDDGTHTVHWRLDHPCPSYLTCFAVGDFVRADDGDFEGRPVAYFACRPHTEADLHRAFGRTRAMLAWMTAKLGTPFPFPKYYQIALPGIGGAMENISLVTWDDQYVLDPVLAHERTRAVDETNLHEMAHSYFGDAVVCRDYAHAWLKESWATYLEHVWFEDTDGDDERAYQFYRDAHAYFAEADGRYKRPIVTREFNSAWQMYDAHLYPGGACRLHTLRCEIGDDAFWSGTRDYVQRYAGHVVETEDFRRVMEAHSGRSLGRFFDQWFHTAGYPSLKVAFRHDAARGEGTFTIEQTQVDPATGGPLFDLATDVGWVADGKLCTQAVRVDRARQTVVVPMPAKPEQVRFDPLGKVLHKLSFNPGEPLLRAQLVGAADVPGRILAGRELAETGKRAAIEAVTAAYAGEPFWGVRVEWATALGKAGAEAAVEGLAAMVLHEHDPRALASVLRAAAGYRDPRIAAAVEARLAGGLPYHATAAAYEALGAQRDGAPIDTLVAAAGTEGYGGFAQAGAFRGLAASRHEDALPLLLDHVGYGATSERSRPAAVAALADIGRVQADKGTRELVVETLVDLLRDPNRRVRSAAVAGLETLRATEAVAALTAYRAPLARQEQVAVDRAVAGIRAGAEPRPAVAEKTVEDLQARLRKLTDRVGDLEARLGLDDGASASASKDGAATAPPAATAAAAAAHEGAPAGTEAWVAGAAAWGHTWGDGDGPAQPDGGSAARGSAPAPGAADPDAAGPAGADR